jgi:fructose/tagatose bisphosphate aldolase
MQEILQDAFQLCDGVGACNIVNDLAMPTVFTTAVETHSPAIVQISGKTVRQWGIRLLQQTFQETARRATIPARRHEAVKRDVPTIAAGGMREFGSEGTAP